MPSLVRITTRIVVGLLILVVLVSAVLAWVPINVDLTRFKGLIEGAATNALGRTTVIDGNISATTSLWPTLEMDGLRLSNPQGFAAGDLARLDHVSVQVAVLPLLAFKVHIEELTVNGLAIDLVRDADGAANWAGRPVEGETPVEPDPPPDASTGFDLGSLTGDVFVIDELSLTDTAVSYSNPEMDEPLTFTLESLTGTAPAGEPFEFDADGALFGEPFTTHIQASSLEELLKDNRADMAIGIKIAGTQFSVSGLMDLNTGMRSANLSAGVSGDALPSLNRLLGLDLPPLEDYVAEAELTLDEERLAMSNMQLKVGESTLTGTAEVNRKGRRSFTATFVSPVIRLQDLDMGDWSPAPPDAAPAEPDAAPDADATPDEKSNETARALFDPAVLQHFDARIEASVEDVTSGGDSLGAGRLVASLVQGRLAIDPLTLELPGGDFLLSMSVKPAAEASAASLRILVDNFDLGVLARRRNPESRTEGTFSLDVDLDASARNVSGLLAGGSGYLHFKANPRDLESGIVDLWAVNVLSAVVSSSAGEDPEKPPESQINCVINHWQMTDGILATESMIIDTTRIRICARGEVDFHENTLKLVAAPTAKRPEFFSLATPIRVDGTFTDFGVGTYGAGIPGTAVRFITSPVATPMRRLVTSDLPEDGADVCATPIGPDVVVPEKYPGCRNP